MTTAVPIDEIIAPDRSRRGHPIVTLVITGAALFMVVLDNLVVTTALPSIRGDLGASVE
jgi:hypothetical protein